MAKIQGPRDNFRIVVNPRSMTDFGMASFSRSFLYKSDRDGQASWEKDMIDRCNEIAADIRRHVDNVSRVSVEWDQEAVCEHCGSRWTEDSTMYNGGCCGKDEANNPEAIKVQD